MQKKEVDVCCAHIQPAKIQIAGGAQFLRSNPQSSLLRKVEAKSVYAVRTSLKRKSALRKVSSVSQSKVNTRESNDARKLPSRASTLMVMVSALGYNERTHGQIVWSKRA